MQKHRIEKVLVVNADFKLKGMITVKDFQKAERKPNACKDDKGRLRVVLPLVPVPATKSASPPWWKPVWTCC